MVAPKRWKLKDGTIVFDPKDPKAKTLHPYEDGYVSEQPQETSKPEKKKKVPQPRKKADAGAALKKSKEELKSDEELDDTGEQRNIRSPALPSDDEEDSENIDEEGEDYEVTSSFPFTN